jgi:hypothetical protein
MTEELETQVPRHLTTRGATMEHLEPALQRPEDEIGRAVNALVARG